MKIFFYRLLALWLFYAFLFMYISTRGKRKGTRSKRNIKFNIKKERDKGFGRGGGRSTKGQIFTVDKFTFFTR